MKEQPLTPSQAVGLCSDLRESSAIRGDSQTGSYVRFGPTKGRTPRSPRSRRRVMFGSRRSHRRGLLCPYKQTSSVRPVRSEKCQKRSFRLSRLGQRTRVHSGNRAFRRPSINSFEFSCPPRAIHADIVNVGSVSSRRAAASRASTSRSRWAKADVRQR